MVGKIILMPLILTKAEFDLKSNCSIMTFYYNIKYFDIFQNVIPVMLKLNFPHHYSSLQCYTSAENHF